MKVSRVPLMIRVAKGGKIEDVAMGYNDPIRVGEIFRPSLSRQPAGLHTRSKVCGRCGWSCSPSAAAAAAPSACGKPSAGVVLISWTRCAVTGSTATATRTAG
jgi:hypothetical protein